MKESGQTTKPMVTEFTLISMEVDTKVNGTKTNNTVTVWNSGLMVPSTKVTIAKA